MCTSSGFRDGQGTLQHEEPSSADLGVIRSVHLRDRAVDVTTVAHHGQRWKRLERTWEAPWRLMRPVAYHLTNYVGTGDARSNLGS
jgi:hypothetical protein